MVPPAIPSVLRLRRIPSMHRRSREFKAQSFELEGRVLLANARLLIRGPEYVEFQGTSIPSSTPPATTTTRVTPPALTPPPSTPPTLTPPTTTTPTTPTPTQVVGQQDGVATVVLTRSDNRGRLQVQVTTDPSSPAVGVNVGAVDQTVTFPNGQMDTAVTIPIRSGAPNPGEVDVNLTISSVAGSRQIMTTGPLDLRILSSDATVAPQIVSTQGKPDGIVLTFSKPMNPVEASNVTNYAVRWTTTHFKYDSLGLFALLYGPAWSDGTSSSSGFVRLKSAKYDPATNSVTLIPKRKLTYSGATGITVTQGHPAKTSGQPGQQSNLGQGLTDLEGNPIGGEFTPGKFSAYVFKGFTYPPH
jgi:hypothetical protein